MGKLCDFIVKYDPDKETINQVTKKILYALFINRIKFGKPCVIFISGESGEGKSLTALKLQLELLEMQGVSLKDNMEKVNIYQPLEYAKKIDALLTKEEKKLNVVIVHEARELVKAKLWHSFINQTISDINAMSRTVKRLITIVISQFIRDISTDIRYTINYYCTVSRSGTKPAHLQIYRMWKDDRDVENPKLRKRKIRGYLVLPNGKRKFYSPQYLEISLPDKELVAEFEKRDFESKSAIIRRKLGKLLKEMEKDIGTENNKIYAMVEWYAKHPEQLNLIGKQGKKGFKINPLTKQMHDLNDAEIKDFEISLNKKLTDMGLVNDEQEKETILPEINE